MNAVAQNPRHAKEKKSKRGLLLLLLLLLVVAAVLLFLFRGALFGGDSAVSHFVETADDGEAFTYENGSGQVFTLNGNALAIVSGTGTQLLDKDGRNLSREIFSMKNPAACSSGDYSVFYDVGGTELRFCAEGETTDLKNTGTIISASVNGKGWFAVARSEAGYKGGVTVYNKACKSVYKWESGSGYPIDAAVSPDCGSLAVLCLDETGSYLKVFRLNSEQEYATASLTGKTCFKLRYMNGGNLCVLSSGSIDFFSGDGKAKNTMDFAGGFLANYELGDSLCAVVISGYETGGNVKLTGLSPGGDVYGETELSEEPASLSVQGQKLLVYMSDALLLYNRDMGVARELSVTPGYKCALLRADGKALLLAAFHGELLDV